MIISLGYMGAYVVLVGVASFIESPVGRGFGAFQLNVLIRTGSPVAALGALVFTHGGGGLPSLSHGRSRKTHSSHGGVRSPKLAQPNGPSFAERDATPRRRTARTPQLWSGRE
jgi:hypothetical protein